MIADQVDGARPASESIVTRSKDWKTAYVPWLVGLAAVNILAFRRWDQIIQPALWVEEGSQFLHQYLQKGWLYLFEPVNGYLIVPSKLVQLLALHISFADLPLWTVIFTLLVSGLVAVAIAAAPINISFRFAAALAPFLIPIDPEPMAVGEYTFWFVGLLSIVALLWRQDARLQWPRYVWAAAGALSSPLAVMVIPLMIGRAIWTRRRSDIITAIISTALGAWQASLVLGREKLADVIAQKASLGNVPLLIEKFAGDYFINTNDATSIVVGIIVLLAIVGLCVMAYRSGRRITPVVLLLCFAMSVLASIVRVDAQDIDATGGAPRYFFYPFTLLAWTMLSLARGLLVQRIAVVAATALPLLQVLSPWYARRHDVLDWRKSAVACIKDAAPPVPEVMPGRPNWQPVLGAFKLDGQFTQPGIVASLGFADVKNAAGSGLAGDAAVGSAQFDFGTPSRRYLAVQVVTGPDAAGQVIRVSGSEQNGPIDLGQLTAQLKGGWQFILFPESQAATGVRLIDSGTGWGQWSAIGEVLGADTLPDGRPVLYSLPVHFDGQAENRWRVDLTHDGCVKLSAGAVLDSSLRR